jgi:hypothetical protein
VGTEDAAAASDERSEAKPEVAAVHGTEVVTQDGDSRSP